ncbi:unnamed protein product [Fraxinus pennsylvanica]|uniref:CCT domain-containing protein n=1 Tax=Fraxinus pennsylvanica TaxID=56036 RepID=A0AAD2AEV7_9LAMI|nr:unnamed protein product [Fraxinus pennsylvanica]
MDYSIPDQYYSSYFFSGKSYNFPTAPAACTNGSGMSMWNEENLPFFNNNEKINMLTPMSSDINSPISSTEQLWVSDMATQALPKDYRDFCDFGVAGGGFEAPFQLELCEQSGCSVMMPNLCQAYPGVGENWGMQGKPAVNVEETAMKVERYSIEERKDRILRYLKKRNQRNFNKTIKYACRKTLADKRVRVRGRFAKNSEPSEYENEKKTNDNSCEENIACYDDSIPMKYDDEDDWLEAAMSSLMSFPYVSS